MGDRLPPTSSRLASLAAREAVSSAAAPPNQADAEGSATCESEAPTNLNSMAARGAVG